MKNSKTIILFITGMLIFSACSSNIRHLSEWNDNSIIVDGNIEDWQNNLFIMEKSNIGYGLTNDNQYLYLCMISGNQKFNRELISRGFYFWFNDKGGSKKQTGIKYPLGKRLNFGAKNMKHDMRNHDNFSIKDIIPTEFEFYKGPEEKIIMPVLNNQRNILIEMNFDDNKNLVYEIRIPFDAISPKINQKNIQTIGVGLELASIDIAKFINHGADMRKNGMNSPRGGQMKGGRNRGGKPPGRTSRSSFEQWIKVDIATNIKE